MEKSILLLARNDLLRTHRLLVEKDDVGALDIMSSSTFQYCLNILDPDNPNNVSEQEATAAYFAGCYMLEHPNRM